MNMNDFNKGIQDIKKIHLTTDEKKSILKQVMQTPIVSPYTPTKTWWNFTYQRFVYIGAFLIIFMLTGGMLVYADQGTVPGDLLYPVKRDITEPIHALLAVTPLAKAQWAATQATRRLSEAETLALKHNLTPQYSNQIQTDFNTSVADFDDDIKSVATTTQKGHDIDTSFKTAMQKHSDILHTIGIEEGDGEQGRIQELEQNIPKISTSTDTDLRKEATSTDIKFNHHNLPFQGNDNEESMRHPDENSTK
jgi:hypothetical protein